MSETIPFGDTAPASKMKGKGGKQVEKNSNVLKLFLIECLTIFVYLT